MRWIEDPMSFARVGSNLTLGKQFLFNFKYFNQMCKCLDGRVIKALDLRSDVHLHVWVRIPLFAITFFCLMIWKHALFMPKFAQARFFQNLHIHLIMTSLKSR